MEPTKSGERFFVYNNYKTLKPKELKKWYEKFNSRLLYLEPIVLFLNKCNIDLNNINSSFCNEYDEIRAIISVLEQMKK